MGSMLNKITKFAGSPEGRRAINSFTNRGTTAGGRTTTGRTTRGRRSAPVSGGAGGTLGKLAGGLLSGRRR